jgi:hypothetical protein
MEKPMTLAPRDWEPQEPSHDFADRVLARVRGETSVSPREARPRLLARATGVGALVIAAAAIVLAIAWRDRSAPARGDAVAADRVEVRIGHRALAVLERGAHVSWNGADVNQAAGDVFYRVEPGGSFDVHTPAGDVHVLGTCFRVQVEEWEATMNGRDLKAGVAGAALSAAVLVSVYEGRVALSHASETATLTAGQSARAGGNGGSITRSTGAEANGPTGAEGADPLVAANANLADTVRDYKRRLEAIEAQKATLDRKLAEAEHKLAAAQNDGQAAPAKSPYDLSPDDWKEMAKEGKVISRMPCASPASWTPTAAQLAKDGLPPGDAQAIHDAREQSYQRVWSVVAPLCTQALHGDAKIAETLGPVTCTALVADVARANNENTAEELRAVAEMRAGLRAYDPKALGGYGQILYVESGEVSAMEAQLTQAIGPDDARAFVYGDGSCWSNNSSTVGPRPTLPPASGSP